MQGQRSSVSTFPENLSFDHGSTSSDPGIDSRTPWSNMQTSAEARLPEYRIPSSETNTQYLHHIGHSEWSLGETSTGAARSQADHNERKREHLLSVHSQAVVNLEECPFETSNILSLDNVDVNGQGNQTSNRSSRMHIAGPDSISQDLNMCSEFEDQEDDECQVIQHPDRRISLGSSNEKRPSSGSSSDALGMSSGCGGYMMEDGDYRPDCSLDGRRLSCKRKAIEVQIVHSSGAGSSNCSEHAERSQWHGVASAQISATNVSMPTAAANNMVFTNGPEQANARIRLGVGGAISSNPSSSNARGTAESPHRNFRLRISGSHQLDHIPGIPLSTDGNVGNSAISSSLHASRFVIQNRLFDLNPTPPVENGSHHGQPVLPHIPSVRRNPHPRWSGASCSRTGYSSTAALALEREGERERDSMLYEESASGNIQRSISEHPKFVPASEMAGSSQQLTNWNLAGCSNSIAGDGVTSTQISTTNVSMPSAAANDMVFSNEPDQENARIRLGVGGAISSNPSSSNARDTAESPHRNFLLRVSGSHQLDRIPGIPLSTEGNVGNSDVSSSRHASRSIFRNRLFNLNPTPPVGNGSLDGQPVLPHIPSMRRNPHPRWSGASSSRTGYSSTAALAQEREREREAMLYEESASGNIHRSILEHPMFFPASEIGGSSQQPTHWNSGWNNSIARDVASTSRAGSAARVNSSSPSSFWSHRSSLQHPRRLSSEMARRSLLSDIGTESGGQSSSRAIRSSSPGMSQETALSSGSGNQGPHSSNTRSVLLLERHPDGSGIPYSFRSLAAASEERSSVMSEIRHVLDLMRRGEGLRYEDMMMLDHSVFLGMADMHDRHRDMRLDVDNMSYEELLALEDRIGNVCTGLNEETITSRLKQRKCAERLADEAETEPCSICREEYNSGEDLGTLECGHDFHRDCIKQWLLCKNLCPICKTTGLST